MFCSKDSLYFLMKHITSSIHKDNTVSTLYSLNICLHDVCLLAPQIIQMTLFCNLKIGLL
jgi:hypothetical protein